MKKQTKKNLFNVALAGAVVTGSLVALAPVDAEAAAKSFKDLKKENVHYNDIMSLVERGVLSGYPEGTFKAGQALTRAEAAVIIANILELDTKNVKDPGLKDVVKGKFYYGAVAALVEKGILTGYGNGTYGVNDTLTRGQMAVILQKAFELDGKAEKLPFTDAKGDFYESYISTLYANGVTAGKTATTYGVKDPVTRGQISTFVVKAEAVSGELVVEIKDGKLVTDKGTYDIDADLAKVFNANNAGALKGAKVKLEAVGTAFASVNTVAQTQKVVLKSLTINAKDVTFDANGYTIPNLRVNGTNVVVKNVVTDKLTIAKGSVVELIGVQVKELVLNADAKIKLDATSKITKLVIPAGKKLEDVISNYEEVKDILKNIQVVDDKGTEVQPGTPTIPTPTTPAPASLKGAVDQLVTVGLDEYKGSLDGVVAPTFTAGDNTIKLEILTDISISEVRTKLEAIDDESGKLNRILTNKKLKDSGIGAVYDQLTEIGFDGATYTVAEILDSETDADKKKELVGVLDKFVDANKDGAKKITDLKGKTAKITFNFKAYAPITYTFVIVDDVKNN